MAIMAQYDSQAFLARRTSENGCCVDLDLVVVVIGVVVVLVLLLLLLPNGEEKGEREVRGARSEEIAEVGVAAAAAAVVVVVLVVVDDLLSVEPFEALDGEEVVPKRAEGVAAAVVFVPPSSFVSGLSTARTESNRGRGSANNAIVCPSANIART